MSTRQTDATQAALAAYIVGAPRTLSTELERAALHAVTDTVAVALGALSHPAAVAARRYARTMAVAQGATLWGSGEVVSPETAALVNGVPLRGYDFNDLYIGPGCGGHPSDIIPGLIAVAEWAGKTGAELLAAIAIGCEVTVALMDTVPLKARGWDYPNVTALGAVCGIARLLGLSEAETREALAITVIPHFASLEIESGELNAQGDLTMWKRFNGSDAVRHAVYAALLARAGVEGAVRPFEGGAGYFDKTGTRPEQRERLLSRLDPSAPMTGLLKTTYKRWPVGSRGQSAIQAALEARQHVGDVRSIREVRVYADANAFEHLVGSRPTAWEPHSRETADHSLPYIVTAAILEGNVGTSSFDPQRVLDPVRGAFLQRVKVAPDEALSRGAAAGFLARVEIIDEQGRVHTGAAKPPPGHPAQPFTSQDFESKFFECVTPLAGPEWAQSVLDTVRRLGSLDRVATLARQLVLPPERKGSLEQ